MLSDSLSERTCFCSRLLRSSSSISDDIWSMAPCMTVSWVRQSSCMLPESLQKGRAFAAIHFARSPITKCWAHHSIIKSHGCSLIALFPKLFHGLFRLCIHNKERRWDLQKDKQPLTHRKPSLRRMGTWEPLHNTILKIQIVQSLLAVFTNWTSQV